jgi:hypothetical protein
MMAFPLFIGFAPIATYAGSVARRQFNDGTVGFGDGHVSSLHVSIMGLEPARTGGVDPVEDVFGMACLSHPNRRRFVSVLVRHTYRISAIFRNIFSVASGAWIRN